MVGVMPGIEGDLRTLATVTEGIDASGFETVDVDVEADSDATCGSVAVAATLFDTDPPEDVRVSVDDCTLTADGNLQMTVDVERTPDATSTPESLGATNGGAATSDEESPESGESSVDADPEPRTDDDVADTREESTTVDEREESTTVADDDTSDGTVDTPSDDDSADAGPESADGSSPTDTQDSSDADDDSPSDTSTDGPAYRDPERLHEVYDPDRTFAEMTEALGVDVTAQTVRKYMIDHGVHDPDPQPAINADAELPADRDEDGDGDDSGAAADGPSASDERDHGDGALGDDGADSPEATHEATEDRATDAATDGGTATATVPHGTGPSPGDPDPTPEAEESGPDLDETIAVSAFSDVEAVDDLTVGDVLDATVGARTLYDVQRALGLESDTPRRLLDDCDLTTLVAGRISRGDGPDERTVREQLAAVVGEE
jgi:hypothetical protein